MYYQAFRFQYQIERYKERGHLEILTHNTYRAKQDNLVYKAVRGQ